LSGNEILSDPYETPISKSTAHAPLGLGANEVEVQ